MKHQQLGKTDLQTPPIVFGTSSLGNLFVALPSETKLAILQQMIQAVPAPVALDSAGKYGAGLALETIGWGLKELGVAANDVVISNKLGWIRTPLTTPEPTFEPGAWVGLEHDAIQDISYQGILRCWEQGSELLGDYTSQMVSVHDPDEFLAAASSEKEREERGEQILAAYQALTELKTKGSVRAVGVGSKDWHAIRDITKEVDLDWVMFANSMTLYDHPTELLAFMDDLQQKGVGIINSAVFNAGFLTGGEYFNYRLLDPKEEANQPLFQWRESFFALCGEFDVRPADACVHFGRSHPGVVSVALNTSKPERIAQNVASVTVEVPARFWDAMKEKGLLAADYPHL
ncbi:MAG: aldo/keto reductase [Chloroflexota bacterium]